jgi:hypothetical protein
MQGNGGGASQRERDNASAMAEEDAWETVNLPRGFVFCERICICYEELYLLRGFVCLFVFFLFTVSHPEGVCRPRKDKGNRLPPLRASPNVRNPPPPACAVRKSRGMGPPYMILIESCGKNEKRRQSTSYPPLLPPSSPVSQTLHWSNLLPWASSTSRPSTVLPIPEIYKNRKNRPSYRGFDSRTRTLHEDLYLLRGFVLFVCLFTGFVFAYELAGARSLFEEGGGVARPGRGL